MCAWAKTRLLDPTAFIARLLLIGLGAFTFWGGGYALSQAATALVAAYAMWTALLFALSPFEQRPWLAWLAPLIDLAAAAAFATLTGLVGLDSQIGTWPLGMILGVAILVALLPSRRLAEWRDNRVWHALVAEQEAANRERVLVRTATQLLATFDPEQVRQATADAASAAPAAHPDQDWLERLAGLAEAASTRCAQHLALQGEEQRLRVMWESLPAPAALWSPAGELVLANAAYTDLQVSVDIAGDEAQRELEIGEPARTFDVLRTRLDGSGCQLALLREITRERQELAAKDEFLSLVGHELRTPLTSIHGFSQMIDRNLSVIKQQVGQLDRLINDLAAESSGTGAKLSLDLQPANLADLATSAAERFKASHPDRTLELDVEEVPNVKADLTRLIQVIDNLLNNAVKYSPADQPIRLSVLAQEGEIVLSVQDEGLGIESEHLTHLFDRFYRVPNKQTEQVKGLGLGLSIVRDLVLAHGGRVWAESEGPDRGSTFLVSLPADNPPIGGLSTVLSGGTAAN
jgi:signal transduction histidine kinase